MTRVGFFLAGFIVGAWCAGLAMRWEQLRPEPVRKWTGSADDWDIIRTSLAWRELERVDSV